MSLRVAVLTTDTAHHRWFVRELHRRLPDEVVLSAVLFETRSYPWKRKADQVRQANRRNPWRAYVTNPYVQPAWMARAAARFEEPRFFPDGDRSLPAGIDHHEVVNVNHDDALELIDRSGSDVSFVYGTGILKPVVFERTRLGAVNAHGGLVPDYRGLDTNLWAAYRGHPSDMAVTLHTVDADIDTGSVYDSRRVPPAPDLRLSSLRYYTTLLCTDMAVDLLPALARGDASPTPQASGGEYFGPMPWVLKLRADWVLRRHRPAEASR